jgi:hypothetical protein
MCRQSIVDEACYAASRQQFIGGAALGAAPVVFGILFLFDS